MIINQASTNLWTKATLLILILTIAATAIISAGSSYAASSVIDGRGESNPGIGQLTLSTSKANDVVILFVGAQDSGALGGVTDTVGLTWHHRASAPYSLKRASEPNTHSETIEEWYAIAPSPLTNDVISVASPGGNALFHCYALAVAGVNTAAPFDTSDVSPAPWSDSTSAGSSNPTLNVYTSSSDVLLVTALWAGGDYGIVSTPDNFVFLAGGGLNSFNEAYQQVSTKLTNQNVTWVLAGPDNWGMIVDAVAIGSGAPAASAISPLEIAVIVALALLGIGIITYVIKLRGKKPADAKPPKPQTPAPPSPTTLPPQKTSHLDIALEGLQSDDPAYQQAGIDWLKGLSSQLKGVSGNSGDNPSHLEMAIEGLQSDDPAYRQSSLDWLNKSRNVLKDLLPSSYADPSLGNAPSHLDMTIEGLQSNDPQYRQEAMNWLKNSRDVLNDIFPPSGDQPSHIDMALEGLQSNDPQYRQDALRWLKSVSSSLNSFSPTYSPPPATPPEPEPSAQDSSDSDKSDVEPYHLSDEESK